ncbi:CIC11C00000005443 [Sungouiella intermedia]|uniref:CIC11C00000005443 n=1 Tax=Sungouiella intermedia TaxID=45354 RepID=A0A1L0G737_9ASCO|nr:CIC11C00000005443 [[Candida] intermedia]
MKFSNLVAAAALTLGATAHPLEKRKTNATEAALEDVTTKSDDLKTSFGKTAIFQPKVFVINMFRNEAKPWLSSLDFAHNITLPGLSPEYPTIHCSTNFSICQMTTGEGEINAASSMTALGLSPIFDLTKTYFLVSGIAGGEPQHTTLGSVTFAKYAVQAALEYQVSYQEFIQTHPNWTSGYWAYGTDNPWTYPAYAYGTEVFELNEKLRDKAVELAETGNLVNGTEANAEFRTLYEYEAAQNLPSVVKCDVLTSDNYFTGNVLGDYFSFYSKMMSNGSAVYCATAQEDNASLEAVTRLDKAGLVDFNRVIVMRTISDMTRPPPSKANDTVSWFNNPKDGGSGAAYSNLVVAGLPIVSDILENWDDVYYSGKEFEPENYTGDIFNTLGGKPDYGKDSFYIE